MWLLKSGPDGYRQPHSHQMPQVPTPAAKTGGEEEAKGGFRFEFAADCSL